MQKLLVFLCFVLLSTTAFAQKHTLENIARVKQRGTGAIIKDNSVTGYYTFYELEKSKGGTRNYQLNILDANLTKLSSKKFNSEDRLEAQEAAYNGDLILIKFLNRKDKEFVLKTFNDKAELVSTKTIVSKKVVSPFGDKAPTDEEGESRSVIPVEGRGFVHYVTRREGGALSETFSEITWVPNEKGAKGWTWETPEKDRMYEFGDVLGSDGKNIYCLLTKRKKLMSRDLEDFVMGIDVTTGKKTFEIPLEDKKWAVSALNGMIDPNGNLRIYGLYFEKDAKTAKESSRGMFGFEMTPAGEIVSREYESWEHDVAKFLPVSSKGRIKDVGNLYFHKFVRTEQGKVFAIAEQFKINAGASIALTGLNMLAGGGSGSILYKIGDMYVLEFDDKFNLKNVTVFDKTTSTVNIDALAGPRIIGMYIDYYGFFDYAFTQMGKDKNTFSSGFVDYSREKGAKGMYFGSINYDGTTLKLDKIKYEKSATWVYPAKPGYVMVFEYSRKEKRGELRLEKLNM